MTSCLAYVQYLTLLCVSWLQMSVEDFLHHIRKQASDDDDDDGKPGRTAGQQLHEHKIHVLRMEEWPGGNKRKCSKVTEQNSSLDGFSLNYDLTNVINLITRTAKYQ